MRILHTTLLITALLITGSAAYAPVHGTTPPRGGIEATTEVPEWMTRACETRFDVNCHAGQGRNERFVRLMPGDAHMICVIYVSRPRLDYCA